MPSMIFDNFKMDKLSVYLIIGCLLFCTIASAQFYDVKKGDIIEINGEKAMVFSTKGDGHGSAISIKTLRGKKNVWCENKKLINSIKTDSKSDGQANTKAVYEYCESYNVSLSQFPAFAWCKSLGDGWYIPSIKEMEEFVNFWLGNEQEFDWDSDDEDIELEENFTTKAINERMIDAGGTPFASSDSYAWVFTSTKTEDNRVFVFEVDRTKNVWKFKKMSPSSIGIYTMGRAFYDF